MIMDMITPIMLAKFIVGRKEKSEKMLHDDSFARPRKALLNLLRLMPRDTDLFLVLPKGINEDWDAFDKRTKSFRLGALDVIRNGEKCRIGNNALAVILLSLTSIAVRATYGSKKKAEDADLFCSITTINTAMGVIQRGSECPAKRYLMTLLNGEWWIGSSGSIYGGMIDIPYQFFAPLYNMDVHAMSRDRISDYEKRWQGW